MHTRWTVCTNTDRSVSCRCDDGVLFVARAKTIQQTHGGETHTNVKHECHKRGAYAANARGCYLYNSV